MSNSLIDFGRIIKRAGFKVDNTKMAEHGFFVLQGIFAGIALNDIWRMLNLPGNNTPLAVAGIPSTFHQDYLWQLGFAVVSGAAEVLGGINHGLAFGSGIFLGSTWANNSEAGNYIGNAAGVPKTTQAAPTPQPTIIPPPSYMPMASSLPVNLTPTPNPGASAYNPMANAIPNTPLAHLP